MPYQPIENYGVVGNLRTVALIGLNGSVDWFCCPHFDSPSVFGAILDEKKGGHFLVASEGELIRSKQFYWPESNVLVTRFYHADGIAEVVDFMPVGVEDVHQLIRRVKVTRGQVQFRMECYPAFDYARAPHTTRAIDGGVCFESGGLRLGLATRTPLQVDERGATARFVLKENEETTFVFRLLEAGRDGEHCGACPGPGASEDLFRQTVAYWRNWLRKCTYSGRWREMVLRSALALKLLTFEPTGAIVAAPTCSLPESIGGPRNWDYRYTWIRDAAFTIYGLVRIGFTDEANAFMQWLDRVTERIDGKENGPLQVVYRIDGSMEIPEEILPHLEGYRGSGPVRIGNGAAEQFQLDIYGELFDAVYLANKYATPLTAGSWAKARKAIDWLAENWQREDEGIWETRRGRQSFTYSKLMCWVAFDRALRLADKRSFPANRSHWLQVRDEIYESIMQQGWSAKRNAFAQSFGTDVLDASVLLMPLVFFTAPTEPRILSTIDAIAKPKAEGGLRADGLIHRYDPGESPDGFTEFEGTFNLCTFWLVEALTRAGRTDPKRLEEARLLFERMLGYANHLGLYAEQTGFTGEALGNYPQAFTHLALVSSAFNLDRALSRQRC